MSDKTQPNENTATGAASALTVELERLLDEWKEAAGHIWMTRSGEDVTAWQVRRDDLAQLVRAAMATEREACAKVCDEAANGVLSLQHGEAHDLPNVILRHRAVEAQDCAAKIRKRSND